MAPPKTGAAKQRAIESSSRKTPSQVLDQTTISQASNSTAPSYFLRVPYEIREAIFRNIFEGARLHLRFFSQFANSCPLLHVLLASRQCYTEAKEVMLQQVIFIVDLQSSQSCAWAVADFDTLNRTDFIIKKPNCPIAQYARRLTIQIDCYDQPWVNGGPHALHGYLNIYKMFPDLRRLHINLALQCSYVILQAPLFTNLGISLTVESLLESSYEPIWTAYKHPPLDVSINIKFWCWKDLQYSTLDTKLTGCIAYVRNGAVEIAEQNPASAEKWVSLPVNADAWKESLEDVLRRV